MTDLNVLTADRGFHLRRVGVLADGREGFATLNPVTSALGNYFAATCYARDPSGPFGITEVRRAERHDANSPDLRAVLNMVDGLDTFAGSACAAEIAEQHRWSGEGSIR